MRIILIGPPMSGKGTQTARLCKELNVRCISTGNILRKNIAEGTPLGLEANKYMKKGHLVPDDMMIDLISEYFEEMGDKIDFVLDGYPRTINQADSLDKALKKRNIELDKVVLLVVDRNVLLSRLTGRMTCENCGATYNLINGKPKEFDTCDQCGKKLSKREDDKLETLVNRLTVYTNQTRPLVEYYEKKGKLVRVDGDDTPDEVFKRIVDAIGVKR